MKIFGSKIDKLARRRQVLIAKRDNAERAMRERNSKRESKSQALINRGIEDWEKTNRYMTRVNSELDKLAREIDSEKIYVQEVAQRETKEYLKDKAAVEAFRKTDKAFPEGDTEVNQKQARNKTEVGGVYVYCEWRVGTTIFGKCTKID